MLNYVSHSTWNMLFDLMHKDKTACLYFLDLDNFAVVRHIQTGDIYVTNNYNNWWA